MALPRVDIVRGAIEHSVTLVVRDLKEAMKLSNEYAPEHLILQIKDAAGAVDLVENAGSVLSESGRQRAWEITLLVSIILCVCNPIYSHPPNEIRGANMRKLHMATPNNTPASILDRMSSTLQVQTLPLKVYERWRSSDTACKC